MSNDYTTVALTSEDKSRLDELADEHLSEDNASYRTIINFLADEYENRQDEYEYVLARAIASADEIDVHRIIQRVESDRAFVEEVNTDE